MVVDDVLSAIERGDPEALRLLLHPYVRWTDASGTTVRGRRNVMARLAHAPPVAPPRSYELRDGQVYRWEDG